MNEQATLLDENDFLGQSLDEVADAPEFVNPPTGSYILGIQGASLESYTTKDKDTQEEVNKKRLRINYTVLKTVELADAGDDPVPNGSMFSETFQTNANGLSFFKRQAEKILGGADNIKGVPLSDLLKAMGDGVVMTAKIKSKESNVNGRTFTNSNVRLGEIVDAPLPE